MLNLDVPQLPKPVTGAPAAPDPGQTWTPLSATRERLQELCSPEVGIVRRTFRQLHDVDDVRVEAVGSQTADSTALLGAPCNELNGGGHHDAGAATAAAISECAERYAAAHVDPSRLVVARADDLAGAGRAHVSPDDLRLFSAEQHADPAFPFAPFRGDEAIAWVPGRDLATGAETLVPACLTFLAPVRWGATIGYPTSNGLAFHASWTEAVAGGLLELCERDAVTRTWYRRLSMPRLVVDEPELREWMDRHVAPTGLDVSLLDLTPLTGCPTTMAVIRNHATDVAPIALGAASGVNGVEAARKAIVEGFQTRIWAKAEQRDGAMIAPTPGFADVSDFDDHVRLSLHPETVDAAAFLDASPETVPVSAVPALDRTSPATVIDDLLSRLTPQGVDVHVVDVTSPDVREAGFHVARAFSPQLQPLDAGYHQRFLGGRRLHDDATAGFDRAHGGPSADLNPWPHPFP